MLNGQLLDTIYSHLIVCGETTLPRIVESIEGKDKIKTKKKEKKLSGSQSLFDFGFKRAKQDDDTGNYSVKKSDG